MNFADGCSAVQGKPRRFSVENRLVREDYARDARVFARALIGTYLVVRTPHDRRDDASPLARIIHDDSTQTCRSSCCEGRTALLGPATYGEYASALRCGVRPSRCGLGRLQQSRHESSGLGHGDKTRAVRIVETEAYCGPKDRASHARAGLTKRTRPLFGKAGHAYVYLIYGMYDCFNIVCSEEGRGHAVLIRAGEPVLGIPNDVRTDGPGRLTRALGITRAHDGVDLTGIGEIFVTPRTERPRIGVSARVGVTYAGEMANAPWRFFDQESAFVSRPPQRSIGLGATTTR